MTNSESAQGSSKYCYVVAYLEECHTVAMVSVSGSKHRAAGWYLQIADGVQATRFFGPFDTPQAAFAAVPNTTETCDKHDGIPARPYPGDEEAVRQSGVALPYCACSRASDDPHTNGCKFWLGILAARKLWMDLNVAAWSCAAEARAEKRCSQWCGHPQFCTASGTDRRRSQKASEPRPCPIPEADGFDIQGKEIGPGIWGVGKANWHPESGDWRGLADINGSLCVVTLKVTPSSEGDPR